MSSDTIFSLVILPYNIIYNPLRLILLLPSTITGLSLPVLRRRMSPLPTPLSTRGFGVGSRLETANTLSERTLSRLLINGSPSNISAAFLTFSGEAYCSIAVPFTLPVDLYLCSRYSVILPALPKCSRRSFDLALKLTFATNIP
jgi:hypothetical protein